MVLLGGNPPCQSAWQFETVFAGTVIEILQPQQPMVRPAPSGGPGNRAGAYGRATAGGAPLSFPKRQVRFQITEALRGLDQDQKEIVIETGMGGGDCGYNFQRGSDYLVYASKNPSGAFTTGICHPTKPLEKAAEELKYFHQLPQAPATAEIRVTAMDIHKGRGPESGLTGVHVTLDGPGIHKSVTTPASGRYVFSDLPPGSYRLEASLEGFRPVQPRPVQVHAKGCAEVLLPLALDRVVTGRIFGKGGLPASGVTIEAVPRYPRRENEIPMAVDSATTDADGGYELRRLATGDYYLGISLSRSPTPKSPYTRWFYPGTEDPALAGIVHVSDKPEALRFDLTLPDAQQSRIIRGTVFWPDGRIAEGARIVLEDPRWSWQTFHMTVTDKDGRFSATALDGTRYRLYAATVSNGTVSAEPVTIEPGSDPLDLKLVLTRQGPSPIRPVWSGAEDWRKGLGLK